MMENSIGLRRAGVPYDAETCHVTVKEACVFLSEYAASLLGCGATCIRIEKNVRRMAETIGVDYSMMIMPTAVQMTVWDKEHMHSYSNIQKIRKAGTSFSINTAMSRLSWELHDGKVDFQEAHKRMEEILDTPAENRWLVLLLASLANASFCRLFGGDFISMGIVFIATLAGFRLRQIMLEDRIDIRIVFICASFVSSVIASAGYVFNIGTTPEIALGTSVLYLVPGVPYLNSMSDLLDGHYISFLNRFLDAMVLTACLSAGLCGGFLVMNLKWF